jgi:hypothetical protein
MKPAQGSQAARRHHYGQHFGFGNNAGGGQNIDEFEPRATG